jgi:dTDP-4-amino-4,6-dideoxygalactose transaminase
MKIPFNRTSIRGKELEYIKDTFARGKTSGGGFYSQQCMSFFQEQFGFKRALMTSSCTDALEMAALLSRVGSGDEVILPSYTFVSTANAFALRGASLKFADCEEDYPNISCNSIESLISPRTKVLVIVHYGGVPCDMQKIMSLVERHNLFLVEDCAHAVLGYNSDGTPLGRYGAVSAFSFHETKNISAGEGGMLCINQDALVERAEILWEKGTNRSAQSRGLVSKYEWLDVGSSFLASDITAAFLWAQLERREETQSRRHLIWNRYQKELATGLPAELLAPARTHHVHNAHLFYLLTRSPEERSELIAALSAQGILAVFHYLPLHSSPFFRARYEGPELRNTERFATCLVRLPLFSDLDEEAQSYIINETLRFFH